MLKIFCIPLLLMCVLYAQAQNTSGLTQQTDTSFTIYSAYKSALKKYPNIKIVKDSLPPSIIAARAICYRTIGKRALLLDAFYPKQNKDKRFPAVLLIYGGGWRSGNRTMHVPLAERLAAQGYACFTADYRLSTEALYPAAVLDLKAALRWIRANAAKYYVDTNRVAVLGFSAGGQLAALLGNTSGRPEFSEATASLKHSDKVQTIVDIDGTLVFIHPESGEGDDSKKLSAATLWFGYNKTERPDLWQQAAALTWAGPKSPPTLFINSSIDRMHAGRQDYINILSQHHIYTEVHAFPDSPHTFCLFEPWFEPTVRYVVSFLDKVLKK